MQQFPLLNCPSRRAIIRSYLPLQRVMSSVSLGLSGLDKRNRSFLSSPTSPSSSSFAEIGEGGRHGRVPLWRGASVRMMSSKKDGLTDNGGAKEVSDADEKSRNGTGVNHVGKEERSRTPWHREGVQTPPAAATGSEQDSASALGKLKKGKLLTTPSKLLKLLLPLTAAEQRSDRDDAAPLALLVHPHQPLSYLERLIQAELPDIESRRGGSRAPNIIFRAMESQEDRLSQVTDVDEEDEVPDGDEDIEGKKESGEQKTGKITGKGDKENITDSKASRSKQITDYNGDSNILGEGGVESYSGAGREAQHDGEEQGTDHFVRWSSSTEIGHFVRDAARAKEFVIEIEGRPQELRVGVPSFNDRTFYLRQRLRKLSRRVAEMASVKKECDVQAHKAAQRLAMAGFLVMVAYWYLVYRLTFQTDLGWDTMEPVTYLIGLSVLMCGYLWFLYHNREASYRAALNLTISRRQSKLYDARGFNVEVWQRLVEEANALRAEIRAIAAEYDVEWDEKSEEGEACRKASRALDKESEEKKKKERRRRGSGRRRSEDGSDDQAEEEDSSREEEEVEEEEERKRI